MIPIEARKSGRPLYRAVASGLVFAAVLAGCATPGVRPAIDDEAAYREVSLAVARNDCRMARDALEAMEQAHPQSAHLPDAYLEAGYTCLRVGDLDTAEALATGFDERFPQHGSADYARYLYALSAYARWRGLADDTPGDQVAQAARETFGRFRALLTMHPDTAYASDIRPLLVDLREGLARVELAAIRADLDAQRHDAVIPRAQYLLTHYGNTPSAPYALAALAEAHQAQGDTEVARRLHQQLESDWPNHPALQALDAIR